MLIFLEDYFLANLTCGNCGKGEYVENSFRYCSGCRKYVVECDCVTFGLSPRTPKMISPRA